ncbi:hypothetical protein PROFUN_07959 [Planoprotostelium fungivorum]|uniref:Uncharacterized protein n=1 Tax=Planoprotostelium fungivorum TaxID=1890364 RepID=A0A2P6NL85_9EUKA|nr:hypothetical protein PROFUN_07959 [Planoprotostelium fungivorum]
MPVTSIYRDRIRVRLNPQKMKIDCVSYSNCDRSDRHRFEDSRFCIVTSPRSVVFIWCQYIITGLSTTAPLDSTCDSTCLLTLCPTYSQTSYQKFDIEFYGQDVPHEHDEYRQGIYQRNRLSIL